MITNPLNSILSHVSSRTISQSMSPLALIFHTLSPRCPSHHICLLIRIRMYERHCKWQVTTLHLHESGEQIRLIFATTSASLPVFRSPISYLSTVSHNNIASKISQASHHQPQDISSRSPSSRSIARPTNQTLLFPSPPRRSSSQTSSIPLLSAPCILGDGCTVCKVRSWHIVSRHAYLVL